MDKRQVTVLLDTHALVWALVEPQRLSAQASRAMADSEVMASSASLWELILKAGKKDALVQHPVRWWQTNVVGNGVKVLNIRIQHISLLQGVA